MESPNSSPSRKRPVKWVGFCGACGAYGHTTDEYVENPHPHGIFCPFEVSGGGIIGVMHFKPEEDQTPLMIPQDIGVDYLPVVR